MYREKVAVRKNLAFSQTGRFLSCQKSRVSFPLISAGFVNPAQDMWGRADIASSRRILPLMQCLSILLGKFDKALQFFHGLSAVNGIFGLMDAFLDIRCFSCCDKGR